MHSVNEMRIGEESQYSYSEKAVMVPIQLSNCDEPKLRQEKVIQNSMDMQR